MTRKEIERAWKPLRDKGIGAKLTPEEHKLKSELNCREMINSCLIYGEMSAFYTRYGVQYRVELGERRVSELIYEQEQDFKKAVVNRNVHTDSEGCSYNSIVWADELEPGQDDIQTDDLDDRDLL